MVFWYDWLIAKNLENSLMNQATLKTPYKKYVLVKENLNWQMISLFKVRTYPMKMTLLTCFCYHWRIKKNVTHYKNLPLQKSERKLTKSETRRLISGLFQANFTPYTIKLALTKQKELDKQNISTVLDILIIFLHFSNVTICS